MEIKDIYKTIDLIVVAQKKARQQDNFFELLENSEALLEFVPALINFSVDQEAEYRKFEAKYTNEEDKQGKRNSGAYAETQAKATDFYKEWQRARQFIDLIYEMVNLGKKLAGSVDRELGASRN